MLTAFKVAGNGFWDMFGNIPMMQFYGLPPFCVWVRKPKRGNHLSPIHIFCNSIPLMFFTDGRIHDKILRTMSLMGDGFKPCKTPMPQICQEKTLPQQITKDSNRFFTWLGR